MTFDFVQRDGEKMLFVKIWDDLDTTRGTKDWEKIQEAILPVNKFYNSEIVLCSFRRFRETMWANPRAFRNLHLMEIRNMMTGEEVHELTSFAAKSAVNQMLTARNWAIGYYIVEFEQKGQDRAEYGSNLLTNLAERLDIKGLDRTMLNLCRIFYLKYPQMCDSVNHRLKKVITDAPLDPIRYIESVTVEGRPGICDLEDHKFQMNPETLITRLSFTHLTYISKKSPILCRWRDELQKRKMKISENACSEAENIV